MPKYKYKTPCKICGESFNSEFIGRKCKNCSLEYSREYYNLHKDELKIRNKRNKELRASLQPPKEKKSRRTYTHDEAKQRNKDRTNIYNRRKQIKNYLIKHPELHVRNPITRNPDREIYADNDLFTTPIFYIDFHQLKHIPITYLQLEYWETLNKKNEQEMSDYINKRVVQKQRDDHERATSDYCKPDPVYGLNEKGILIKFYPT